MIAQLHDGELKHRLQIISKLIQLKDRPFLPYQQFYIMFQKDQPMTTVFKTGRQVSKTTSSCVQAILQCAIHPNFVSLYVMPREEQASNTSVLFFRPIIKSSLITNQFVKPVIDQVMKYQFSNNSAIILSNAFHDAERIRGIPTDRVHVDEVQDISEEFLPVIEMGASASQYRFILYTGTPKTHVNTLQMLWNKSSQAEWCIKCEACNHWNIPSIDHDALAIIGPVEGRNISKENPGTICARCGRTIYPQTGCWVHRYPSRKAINAGYHIPQIVIELHYADPIKWQIIWNYKNGLGQTTHDDFIREVLGEPADICSRIISLTDLLKVATLGSRFNEEGILSTIDYYRVRALGIDWGGGGKEGNFTTLALVCLAPNGKIHVPWGMALPNPHDHIGEGQQIMRIAEKFKVHLIAHDYSGAGSLRETFLIQAGFPASRLMPCRYTRFLQEGVTIKFCPPAPHNPRQIWEIDSTRAFLMVAGAIKVGHIEFFNDDYISESDPGLLRHFLSLVDEMRTERGVKTFRIVKEEGTKDEFAQATMLGCLAIWNSCGTWPRYG